MKRELRKALEVLAGEQMQLLAESSCRVRKLPKSDQCLTYPGEIVFAEAKAAVTAFTCFIPDERRNAFTIELGWSVDGEFPRVAARPSLQPQEALSGSMGHGFVRLSEFYSRLGEDWDVAPIIAGDPSSFQRFMAIEMKKPTSEESLEMLRPLILDAVEKWKIHAPQFFSSLDQVLLSGT